MRHLSVTTSSSTNRWLRAAQVCALGILLCTCGTAVHAQRACELAYPLVFADLDWDSARLHNAIASFIVERGYGCAIERVPSSTLDGLELMKAGSIDVMMEV